MAGNIDGLMTFIHKMMCLRIKLVPYRIRVRRLSSIFYCEIRRRRERAAARVCGELLSEIDVIDRANKVIFGINTRSGSAWNRRLPPFRKSRVLSDSMSGTAGKARVDVSKHAFRTI